MLRHVHMKAESPCVEVMEVSLWIKWFLCPHQACKSWFSSPIQESVKSCQPPRFGISYSILEVRHLYSVGTHLPLTESTLPLGRFRHQMGGLTGKPVALLYAEVCVLKLLCWSPNPQYSTGTDLEMGALNRCNEVIWADPHLIELLCLSEEIGAQITERRRGNHVRTQREGGSLWTKKEKPQRKPNLLTPCLGLQSSEVRKKKLTSAV